LLRALAQAPDPEYSSYARGPDCRDDWLHGLCAPGNGASISVTNPMIAINPFGAGGAFGIGRGPEEPPHLLIPKFREDVPPPLPSQPVKDHRNDSGTR
jgi:hypothetical protein